MHSPNLPHSPEAEEGVLGSIIIDPEAIVEASLILRPEDFYNNARRTLFDVILYLYQKKEPADFITICDELESRAVSESEKKHPNAPKNALEEVGGGDYITSLINRVPTSGNVGYYANIVQRKAECRELIRLSGKIAQMAYNEEDDVLQQSEAMILKIGQQRVKQDFVSLRDYFPTYLSRLEDIQKGGRAVRGCSTGLQALDGLLGGLQRGKLYVPAARPGVGKTTIVQNFAYRGAIKHGHRFGFFSVEMSKDDLMDRFVSMHTKINSLNLQNGALDNDMWQLIVNAESEMEKLGIYFEYTPGIYIDDLASMARRLVQRHEIDVLVIDYLQLLRARIDGKRIQVREMEVAEIARNLKMLAGELNVAVVAPAQINRQVERTAVSKETDSAYSFRMPVLADLRESGEIEQSADVVMFLARAEENEKIVRLNVAKQRGGPTGNINLYFEGETTRFMPLESRYDQFGNVIDF